MVGLLVQVKPGASHDEIRFEAPNRLWVKIKAKPIDGIANEYLIDYLARILNISRSRIMIQKGAASRVKRISVGMEQKEWSEKVKILITE